MYVWLFEYHTDLHHSQTSTIRLHRVRRLSTILIYIILKPQTSNFENELPSSCRNLWYANIVNLNFTSICIYYIPRNGICIVQFLRFDKQQRDIMMGSSFLQLCTLLHGKILPDLYKNNQLFV